MWVDFDLSSKLYIVDNKSSEDVTFDGEWAVGEMQSSSHLDKNSNQVTPLNISSWGDPVHISTKYIYRIHRLIEITASKARKKDWLSL